MGCVNKPTLPDSLTGALPSSPLFHSLVYVCLFLLSIFFFFCFYFLFLSFIFSWCLAIPSPLLSCTASSLSRSSSCCVFSSTSSFIFLRCPAVLSSLSRISLPLFSTVYLLPAVYFLPVRLLSSRAALISSPLLSSAILLSLPIVNASDLLCSFIYLHTCYRSSLFPWSIFSSLSLNESSSSLYSSLLSPYR